MWKKQKGRVNEGFGMKGQAGRETETASLQKKKGNFTLLNMGSNGILPQRSFRLHSIRSWGHSYLLEA